MKIAFPNAKNSYKPNWIGFGEIDVYIPSLALGIEYDGANWHKKTEKDLSKLKLINEHGISLLHIREPGLPLVEEFESINIEKTDKQFLFMQNVVNEIITYINQKYDIHVDVDVDIERDRYKILAGFRSYIIEHSLGNTYSELNSEWDYENNDGLTPFQVTPHTDIKVNWVCSKCGFHYKAAVGDRTGGHGCPACAGLTVVSGKNDLATMRPNLLDEWDYEMNYPLTPESIAYRSNKKVFWCCKKCGNKWKARLADRSAGRGCLVCNHKIAIPGKNDLASVNPKLAAQWDYEKNGELRPSEVLPNSNKRVWWKCNNCGNTWSAFIYSRHANGYGCPKCHVKP